MTLVSRSWARPRLRTSGSHPRLLFLALVAAALALACATDDGGGEATPTTAATASGQTTEGSPTPTPTVGSPSPSPSPTPTATGTAGSGGSSPTQGGEETSYGVVTIEVASAEVTALYDAPDSFRARAGSTFAPWPREQNGALWLSPTTEEASRYGLDGEVTERLEGWGVIESADGGARSYFEGDAQTGVTLIAEREGGPRHEVPASGASNRTLSPDGAWLAWLDTSDPARLQVMTLDLETGETRAIAEVAPCRCDGYHFIEWSPSGRYLAYDDPVIDPPSQRAVYVMDVRPAEETADAEGTDDGDTSNGSESGDASSGEPVRVPRATPQGEGWLEADGDELLLVLVEGVPTLIEAATGDTRPLPVAESGALRARVVNGLVMVTSGQQPGQLNRIFDPVSGEQVRELRGEADVVLTPDGIASAAITRNDIACTGIHVEHPAFEDTLPCDADHVRWSPDGRYLALIPLSASAPVTILEPATGDTHEVPHVGPRGTIPGWSEDSRYLVWIWGDALR